MARVIVDLKERSYEIIIESHILSDVAKLISDKKWGRDVFIITDPLVNDLYGGQIRKPFKVKPKTIEIPRGERYKNLKLASKIFDELAKEGAHRDSLIIALGGGVIGDLAGFVASTYMRGINYLQVPTTLLAQVDAAIGGKTAVNHPKCKNLIGTFYQPKAVIIDVNTITSLPTRELRTGLAEVVKYGVIKDASFFKFLEENAHHLNIKAFENDDTKRAALKLWQTIVAESAKIKAKVVEKDERESDLRMILNYGHTIGHAIESLTKYRSFNHGEAVAIGMVGTAWLAHLYKMLELSNVSRIKNLLDNLGLPTSIEGLPADKILRALFLDKKVSEGKIKYVLPQRIGEVIIRNDIPLAAVKQVLIEMGAKQ